MSTTLSPLSMCSFACLQVTLLCKYFITMTLIWTISTMYSFVRLQVIFLCKCVITLSTLIWTISTMYFVLLSVHSISYCKTNKKTLKKIFSVDVYLQCEQHFLHKVWVRSCLFIESGRVNALSRCRH